MHYFTCNVRRRLDCGGTSVIFLLSLRWKLLFQIFRIDLSSEDEEDGHLEKAARAVAHLQLPEKAAIARTRRVQSNPAKLQSGKNCKTNPKVSTWDRVDEHRYASEFNCCW